MKEIEELFLPDNVRYTEMHEWTRDDVQAETALTRMLRTVLHARH